MVLIFCLSESVFRLLQALLLSFCFTPSMLQTPFLPPSLPLHLDFHVQFSHFLRSLSLLSLPTGGSRLVFVIGGAEGLPPSLKKSKELWSLSKLTFTHQWARVLLTEQIYRATEIKKGSGYHKE